MEKATETKDQNNKLDEKESQPAVNIIGDSCSNKEKQMTTKSSRTQDAPCKIKGVLAHVQLSHTFCFRACSLQNKVSDPPHCFYISDITYHFTMIKFCRKKINVTNFFAQKSLILQ